MSSNEYEETDETTDNMEQEDTVKVEEAIINLGCVKREIDQEEFEFEKKHYKLTLTYETIFGEGAREQKNNIDSLIGFLDDEVIMETGTIKLEENKDIIRNIIEQSCCSRCGGNYEGYCLNCSSLSHILNNITPNLNPEPDLNTTPINVLEIRDVSSRRAVFALKTLPKGIILGPFEGIAPIENTAGPQWKIKDKKFVNDQNCNWMKYIGRVANPSSKNLDVFQFDKILYFETSREIQEGEELLVRYGMEEEEVLKSENEEEFYCVPVKMEELSQVFACTLCCLGFRLEKCLVEHKRKCPQGDPASRIEDFEIIQCRCCKVWLEKKEHLQGHMMNCLENYNRLCRNISDFQRRHADQVDERHKENRSCLTQTEVIDYKYSDGIGKANKKGYFSEKKHKCSKCSYETSLKHLLRQHLNTHNDTKSFECDICKQRFGHKRSLKLHIKNKHSNTNEKEYKCSECSFQTKYKGNLKLHVDTHNNIKAFECDICRKRYSYKRNLMVHIIDKHSNTNEKEYKCYKCFYQTNHKASLNLHINTHNDIKPFECDICKKRFTVKRYLKEHIHNRHSNISEKKYKCSQCPYQINHKGGLKRHLNTHNYSKPFECDICKMRFTRKGNLKLHIENMHSNTREKGYKCSKCSFKTNHKGSLLGHLNTHTNIKAFQCDICKQRFTQKGSVKVHIKAIHSNASEKEYKCPKCSYQTYYKCSLKLHLNTHTDIKAYACDICKNRFSRKSSLNRHIINQHSNTSENETMTKILS